MGKIVHALLDEETCRLVERLRRQTGWPESEIIRRGIKLLASPTVTSGPREIVGLGKLASGLPDLGSSKRHLDGFGRR